MGHGGNISGNVVQLFFSDEGGIEWSKLLHDDFVNDTLAQRMFTLKKELQVAGDVSLRKASPQIVEPTTLKIFLATDYWTL